MWLHMAPCGSIWLHMAPCGSILVAEKGVEHFKTFQKSFPRVFSSVNYELNHESKWIGGLSHWMLIRIGFRHSPASSQTRCPCRGPGLSSSANRINKSRRQLRDSIASVFLYPW